MTRAVKKRYCLLLFCISLFQTIWAQTQISIPRLPEEDAPYRNHDYSVAVSIDGQKWDTLQVLLCSVDTRHRSKASFAEFDLAGGPIRVRVTNRRKEDAGTPLDSIRIKPTQRSIKPSLVNDSTIEFVLPRPEYLSVEYGGDQHHNLHLFANPMLTEHYTGQEPDCINWTTEQNQDIFFQGARLIYFGPGVHRPKDLPSAEIKIPSNTTVYIAPGAVVKARLIVDRAENVRIISRGILDHPLRGLEITFSKHVYVDGLTVLNPQHYTVYGGQSEHITLRNIKAFSDRGWSDGIDLMCCKHVKIENVFLRNSDDCLALYNHRWWYWGGTEDIDASRMILWCDLAHPVNIGSHGDDRNPTGEVLERVRIYDSDVIYQNGEGMLSIACGDKNIVRDVRFDNIRIDDVPRARLFDIRITFSPKYNRAPGNLIDDITYSNIKVWGKTPLLPSRIEHYDATHRVGNIKLHNVMVNGREMKIHEAEVRTVNYRH